MLGERAKTEVWECHWLEISKRQDRRKLKSMTGPPKNKQDMVSLVVDTKEGGHKSADTSLLWLGSQVHWWNCSPENS